MRLAVLAFSVLGLLACSDVGSDTACADGEGRCEGDTHQVCSGGSFVDSETCVGESACFASIGCGQCDPEVGSTCVGSAVNQCLPDGTVGGQLYDCGQSGCMGGTCRSDCMATGVDLIYVVDDSANFYSFDPRKLGGVESPFTPIGTLDCPASPALPEQGGGTATPFSMSVDRSGRAWVLYNSGEIFWVSTVDARCSATLFSPGDGGFELFGMGFVTDGTDTEAETLFIAGGSAMDLSSGDLGWIDGTNLGVTRLGPLQVSTISTTNNPELTGTGDALLYGYYPGVTSAVVQIDKTSGSELQGWELQDAVGVATAWAFAQWGGELYIFLSTTLGVAETSAVIKFNPLLGSEEVALSDTGIRVVGAGVSTCAPSQIE